MDDPYHILGVNRDATPEVIKAAYRKLAMKYHPDQNPNDKASEEKFKEITQAYDAIINPKTSNNPQWGHTGPGMNNDFFDSIIRQMHEQFRQQQQQNQHYHVEYVITLEEAFHGKSCKIVVNNRDIHLIIPKGIDDGYQIIMEGHGSHENKDYPAGNLYVTIRIKRNQRFSRIGDDLILNQVIDAIDAIVGAKITIVTID